MSISTWIVIRRKTLFKCISWNKRINSLDTINEYYIPSVKEREFFPLYWVYIYGLNCDVLFLNCKNCVSPGNDILLVESRNEQLKPILLGPFGLEMQSRVENEFDTLRPFWQLSQINNVLFEVDADLRCYDEVILGVDSLMKIISIAKYNTVPDFNNFNFIPITDIVTFREIIDRISVCEEFDGKSDLEEFEDYLSLVFRQKNALVYYEANIGFLVINIDYNRYSKQPYTLYYDYYTLNKLGNKSANFPLIFI